MSAPGQPGPSAANARLYVYYRVPEAQLAATVAAVRQMQAALAQTAPPGAIHMALLRRPEAAHGDLTLMEAYVETLHGALGAGFEAALAQAAQALPQPRHVERFELL